MRKVLHRKGTRTFIKILAGLAVIGFVCDMRLKTVEYTIVSGKVNNPVKIALITDLHSDRYGKGQKNLIKAVDQQKPDVVLFGGDIFDDKKPYDNAEEALKKLAEKYPCYYVTGNHEYWGGELKKVVEIVENCGVRVLSGECDTVEINGQYINICGVDDPAEELCLVEGESIEEQLDRVYEQVNSQKNEENFTVLLSHRPELYATYEAYGFDLVLSGHAHGGQWRIPFILNGLYAPNQGLFPEYAGGLYEYDGGKLIVSRGLARESTPIPRIFNRPELVIVVVE